MRDKVNEEINMYNENTKIKSLEETILYKKAPFGIDPKNIYHLYNTLHFRSFSGETFLVEANDGKKYKLHWDFNEHGAEVREYYCRFFQKFLPKLIGRDREFLLFEWIEDSFHPSDKCDNFNNLPESEKSFIYYNMGKMLGEGYKKAQDGHLVNIKDEDINTYFAKLISNFSFNIGDKDFPMRINLIRRFEYLKELVLNEGYSLNHIICFCDLSSYNFVYTLNENGKVDKLYYVDEGGIKSRIVDMPISKLFYIKKSINKENRKLFLEGFNEFQDASRWTNSKNYRELLTLITFLRNIIGYSEIKKGLGKIEGKLKVKLTDNDKRKFYNTVFKRNYLLMEEYLKELYINKSNKFLIDILDQRNMKEQI